METRTITQVKIYKLYLNPMRGNTEDANLVAIAYYKDQLIRWYEDQIAPETWKDYGEIRFPAKGDFGGTKSPNHCFHKAFLKGSKLEWYNPVNLFDTSDMLSSYGHGIQEQWIEEDFYKHGNVNFFGIEFIK